MLDSVVEEIVNARDEEDALHWLNCQKDIQHFYFKTLRYRVEDELPFYYKMVGFKTSSKSKPLQVTPKQTELLLFINEMKKIVQELWPDLGAKPPKAARLFEGIELLQAAVEANDSHLIEMYSICLWDSDRTFEMGEHRFRKALAEVSGADLYKVQLFEKFLLSVVRHRRWFNSLTQSSLDDLRDDFLHLKGHADLRLKEDGFLGLEIVKKYIDPDSYLTLQFPWLSDFLLLMVFDGLLFEAKYSAKQEQPLPRFREHKNMPLLMNNLTLFRDEICARHYDAQELRRRLRHMEDEEGSYVIPSLVYALLATQERCT
jgi:hypothetical protein